MARLDQLFSSGGDGTGTTEMATTAAAYTITPGANQRMQIERINTLIQDDAKFAGEKYTGAGALANGIIITKENADGVLHTFTPQPIKTVGHWGLLAGVDVFLTDWATGNDIFLIRWTLSRANHITYLDGRKGEFLKVNVQDSLAEAVSHMMQAQGNVWWVA